MRATASFVALVVTVVLSLLASGRAAHRDYLVDLYLDTMKFSLSGHLLNTDSLAPGWGHAADLTRLPYNSTLRDVGEDWPDLGLTMIGHKRLDNIRKLLLRVFTDRTHGQFVECGVWRGGASIFAKAVIQAYKSSMHVYLVDSFAGLPGKEHDIDLDFYPAMHYLKVSQDQVRDNFERHNLLDLRVHFVKGFFNESVPRLAARLKHLDQSIAILRLDGDMYMSLMDCLFDLYELVSVTGYIIIDDWTLAEARRAVEDFMAVNHISETFVEIDRSACYFQKTRAVSLDRDWYHALLKNTTRVSASKIP